MSSATDGRILLCSGAMKDASKAPSPDAKANANADNDRVLDDRDQDVTRGDSADDADPIGGAGEDDGAGNDGNGAGNEDDDEGNEDDGDEDGDDGDDDDEIDASDLATTLELARALYRAHPLGGRMRIAAATAFTLLFLSMMLVRGINDKYREPLWPLIGWYTDGLGMARSWGMFAHPDTELPIFAYGETESGELVQISPPAVETTWNRIVDMRMRKIRAHMGNEDTRKRWGQDFTLFLCRTESTASRPLRTVRLVRINRMNAGPGETLLTTGCRKP